MDPRDVQKLLKHNEQASPYINAYSVYMYVMFVLSSLLTFISLYLFLNRRSKLHAELKAIVTHTTLSSYALTATMTLWQVVVLPPYVGGYPVGILFKMIGPYSFLFGLWVCWSCVIHLGITYTVGFSLQVFRMKIAGHRSCLTKVFEWFLEGNASFFLRCSAVFNFLFAAIPVGSLAWYTIPTENEPLLNDLKFDHPALILIVIRYDYIFLGGILICGLIVTLELAWCSRTNWSTFKIVRKTSSVVTAKTHLMQLHMYRLYSFQLFMIIVFYYLPTLIAILHMMEWIDLKNFATGNICFMLWHCPVQAAISLLGYPGIRKKITQIGTISSSKLSKIRTSLT